MFTNDFEKQARQLLDEVKIHPNAKVWLQVEKEIRERKRRRWLFIFPLLAGLGFAGYIAINKLNNNSDKPSVYNSNTKIKEGEKQIINNTPLASLITDGTVKATELNNNAPITINKNDNKKSLPAKPIILRKNKNYTTVLRNSNKSRNATSDVSANKKEEKELTSLSSPVEKTLKTEEQNLTINNTSEIKIGSQLSNAQQKNDKNSVIDSVTKKLLSDRTKPKSLNNKWQWGLNFSTGYSNIKNDFLAINLKAEKAIDIRSYSPVAPVPVSYPSANYKAFAMQAGIFVQKDISKRSQLSLGLNYALYQTRITIGSRITSVPILASNRNFYVDAWRGYSAIAPNSTYHSQLHYLELPVIFSTQLNKGKKLPLHWNGGVSLSRLLSSNYLHFDTANGGVYFKDNQLLNKTSYNVQTGFELTFFASGKTPMSIGPHIQFGLSDLLRENDDKRYLLYGGMRMKLLFSQKKKN
ncbi:MAG TPA: outer membrane beta-barrel protein [Chitinophagaceae bacterium]|nr:outer membrane beta-barrel protein [Chitinophagaceae bacterium]